MTSWQRRFGAWPDGGGTRFRVWAPDHAQVDLVVERGSAIADAPRHPSDRDSDASRGLNWLGAALRDATVGATLVRETARRDVRKLTRTADGVWESRFDDLHPGTLYRYRLDNDDAKTFPDPASRFQPQGVHGPSEVIDAATFAWTDGAWGGVVARELVVYELHVGTFTAAGTFAGTIERLPALQELGVTALELMPVADFAGDRNWGYDGAALFAPARCYGRPDDLRRLVDAAHAHGLAVFVDVVYNHLGPDGAYVAAFSPYCFSDRHESPWGRAINLDGPHSDGVRCFFIDNAIHWCREYHVDGLRLDATHAFVDEGPVPFLRELSETVRAAVAHPVHLIAEDHRNLATLVTPADAGGWGLDAVWADDFHHQVRVHLAHDRNSYYGDFTGSTADLATTIAQGWFYTGQHAPHFGGPRGTVPAGLAPRQFVVCLQNHDQVGNRAMGDRLHGTIDPAAWRAASTLLLVVPETPMLFMGQEWSASTPFLYFTDHGDDLGRRIAEGRRREFAGFESFSDPDARRRIPDPQDPRTFEASVLRWEEREHEPYRSVLHLYERLLALRRDHPALRGATWDSCDVSAPDTSSVVIWRWPDEDGDAEALLAVVHLDGDGTVRVPLRAAGRHVDVRYAVLTTEDAAVSPDAQTIAWNVEGDELTVTFSRPGAAIYSIART